jgi:hypothetical protein
MQPVICLGFYFGQKRIIAWNQHILQTDKRTIKNNEEDPYFEILNRDYGQQEIGVAHPSACTAHALLVVAVCRRQVVHTSQKLDGTKIKRSS